MVLALLALMYEDMDTIAGLVAELFEDYLELYRDEELARVATSTTVNELLLRRRELEEYRGQAIDSAAATL